MESPLKELQSESFHGLVALLVQKLESSEVKSCHTDFCKMGKKWYTFIQQRQKLFFVTFKRIKLESRSWSHMKINRNESTNSQFIDMRELKNIK